MASSRRTYDTDVITLRTVFAKNVVNSNIPAQRVLTADGAGGTYWAIPSSLGENPAFNEIITSAGTYTADLSYNRFRLLAGEGIGMVNGPVGSNQTTLYSKAFSQVDVSGDNAFYAFTSNSVTPIIRVAATGSIQVRSDPGTNTLFIDGPKTAPYIVSTGIYGFNQLKVTPAASTITSSVIGWQGDFITANSPSTLLRFIGVNDIQLSTNVTANSVFFTISTFNSQDYLNISTTAYTAYPKATSSISSLYTSLELFNSTVNYLSTMDTASYSTLKSTIDGIAMSTGLQFYILTGLINARATIIQLNSEISNVNLNIQSTSIGLGSLGYISTGGGAPVGQEQLVSTVIGLGTSGYLSTAGAANILALDLTSTVTGLGSSGYVSSLSTITTSSIFNTGAISTYSLEVFGPATFTSGGSTILRGPTVLQGPTVIQGPVTLVNNTGLVSASNITSTVNGLATVGYVSTPSLVSSLVGLGSLNYISSTQLQSSVQGIYRGIQSTVGGLGQIYISTAGGTGNIVTANLTSTVGGLGQIYISTAGGGITSGNLTSTVGGLGQIYISTAGGGITSGNLVSTVGGLGEIYISTAGGGITSANLVSTVGGLGQIYISTAGGGTGNITTANLNSSITGLGSAGFVSTASLISTVEGIGFYQGSLIYDLVTPSTVRGLGTAGYVSSTQLNSTVRGLGTSGFISSTQLNSSIEGLGTAGYVSTLSLVSTFIGLQRSDFVSSPNLLNLVSTPNLLNLVSTSALNFSLNSTVSGLATSGYVSTTQLVSTVLGIGAGGGGVITATSLNSTITGLATTGYISSLSLISTVNSLLNRSAAVPFVSAFTVSTGSLNTSTISFPYPSTTQFLWVVGNATAPNTLRYSSDTFNWANCTGSLFATSGNFIGYNNSNLWVAVGQDTIPSRSTIKYSIDGINWTNAAGSVFTLVGRGVAYNGRQWLVLGADNGASRSTIKYSGDGINWSNAAGSVFTSVGYSAAWNGSTWVVGGCNTPNDNATIKYSGDGINWSNSGAAFNRGTYGVAWNGSLFVAVGDDALGGPSPIKYSGDGLLWSNATNGGFDFFGTQVAWNGSYWLAAGSDSSQTRVRKSTDGINWTSNVVYTNSGTTRGLTWNGSIWLFGAGAGTPALKYSGDGENWSNVTNYTTAAPAWGPGFSSNTPPSTQTIRVEPTAIVLNNTLRVDIQTNRVGINTSNPLFDLDVGGAGRFSTLSTFNINLSSINGQSFGGPINSTVIGLGTSGYISTLTLTSTVNSLLIRSAAVPFVSAFTVSTGSLTASTITAVQMSSIQLSTGRIGVSSIFFPYQSTGQFLWVGGTRGIESGASLYYSGDTLNWAPASGSLFSQNGIGVAYNNSNLWVAVGLDTSPSRSTIKYSVDGINWSNAAGSVFTQAGQGIAYNGRLWVAGGNEPANSLSTLKYSGDGINWSNAAGAVFNSVCYTVAWNGSVWLAGGGNNPTNTTTIKYSGDGINWSNSGAAFGQDTRGFAWNGTYWIAVGRETSGSASIKYSGDGLLWSNATGGAFNNWGQCVAWNGSYFLAGGYDTSQARIRYSTDGLTWTSNVITANNAVTFALTWSPTSSTWVACTDLGVPGFKYSGNGINWSNTNFGTQTAYAVAFSSNTPPSTPTISFQATSIIINNTLRADIQTNRVGINTTSPQFDFDVNGTGRFSTISSIEYFGNRALISSLMIGVPTVVPSTTTFRLVLTNDSATKPLTTSWTVASDQRIKENIVDANTEICYDTVKLLKLRRFEYTSSFSQETGPYDNRVLGFIAQEVSSILPKSVIIEPAFGYSNFFRLNVDQINFSLFGAVQKTIHDKEYMESTIKGQRFEIETLRGTQTFILSTLEGLQGR